MSDEIANLEGPEDHDRDLPGSDQEPGSGERAIRLKEAVRQAGGPLAVAHASGIPKGTIFSYLRGRDMRASGLVALARATGVRLEWLATGEGPMRPGEAAPSAPQQLLRAVEMIDLDDLVVAYNAVVGAWHARGVTALEPRKVLALTLHLYDAGRAAMTDK